MFSLCHACVDSETRFFYIDYLLCPVSVVVHQVRMISVLLLDNYFVWCYLSLTVVDEIDYVELSTF